MTRASGMRPGMGTWASCTEAANDAAGSGGCLSSSTEQAAAGEARTHPDPGEAGVLGRCAGSLASSGCGDKEEPRRWFGTAKTNGSEDGRPDQVVEAQRRQADSLALGRWLGAPRTTFVTATDGDLTSGAWSSKQQAPSRLLLEVVTGVARRRGRLGWPRQMEAHGTAAVDVGAPGQRCDGVTSIRCRERERAGKEARLARCSPELVGGGETTTGPSRGSVQEELQKKLLFGGARRISSPWIVCAR